MSSPSPHARRPRLLAFAAVLLVAGHATGLPPHAPARRPADRRPAMPTPIATGGGRAYRLAAAGPPARHGAVIDGLACTATAGRRSLAHLELFAHGLVVPIPPGIGVAPPVRRAGAYVTRGRCSYPVRTRDPTGLLELRTDVSLTLGQLFAVWGQPLSRRRLAGFRAPGHSRVRLWIDGRRRSGDPGRWAIPTHGVVVLEVGPSVAPHVHYVYPPGR